MMWLPFVAICRLGTSSLVWARETPRNLRRGRSFGLPLRRIRAETASPQALPQSRTARRLRSGFCRIRFMLLRWVRAETAPPQPLRCRLGGRVVLVRPQAPPLKTIAQRRTSTRRLATEGRDIVFSSIGNGRCALARRPINTWNFGKLRAQILAMPQNAFVGHSLCQTFTDRRPFGCGGFEIIRICIRWRCKGVIKECGVERKLAH
mmetsp:Transcript_8423/g.23422  ORF Transcript_8423/g.23422 Transcript_8423/m.23422 type:complete len:206 (+) Transcript_8423:1771-2388(+)